MKIFSYSAGKENAERRSVGPEFSRNQRGRSAGAQRSRRSAETPSDRADEER